MHYSSRAEKNCVNCIRSYIRWHGLRYWKERCGKKVDAVRPMLANVRQPAPTTHRRALGAVSFLYKDALDLELPRLQNIGWAVPTKCISVVVTADEVRQIQSCEIADHG